MLSFRCDHVLQPLIDSMSLCPSLEEALHVMGQNGIKPCLGVERSSVGLETSQLGAFARLDEALDEVHREQEISTTRTSVLRVCSLLCELASALKLPLQHTSVHTPSSQHLYTAPFCATIGDHLL